MQDKYARKRFFQLTAVAFFFVTLFAGQAVRVQSVASQVEVGGQLSIIDLRESVGEKPLGVGGRFTYNVTENVAFDAEVNYFSTPEVDLNRTQGVFGIKAGKRFGSPPIGLFAKARPGFMRFHGERFPGVTVNGTTKLALDLGGVVELYPSKRTIVRIDVGDTIIFYNGETIRRLSLPGGPQEQLDTGHNLQTSIGFSFRF